MNTETDQTTFLSRIGKWFKKDAATGGNGNLPLEGEVHGHAGTAMDDGHRHRQRHAIGLQMRRERSIDPGGHGDF